MRLMHRLIGNVSGYLIASKLDTRVPAEFLAALTANESGGDPQANRFEPGVYQHLKSVAEGLTASYGSIGKSLLYKEIHRLEGDDQAGSRGTGAKPSPQSAEPAGADSGLATSGPKGPAGAAKTAGSAAAAATAVSAPTADRPPTASDPKSDTQKASTAGAKAESYHAEHLTAAFSANSAPALSALEDEAIRRLATSWGLTQIMGYHMLGRPEPVAKLCDPAYHYRIAAQMVEEFASRFHLDPERDFEALFRCWNTGRPDGKTYDPSYVQNGMRRIEICRQLKAAPAEAHSL
jgi:hypothetical protein